MSGTRGHGGHGGRSGCEGVSVCLCVKVGKVLNNFTQFVRVRGVRRKWLLLAVAAVRRGSGGVVKKAKEANFCHKARA